MSDERRKSAWFSWAILALLVVLVLYPLSYPWAQGVMRYAAMSAAKRGEQLPYLIDDAGTKFYTPLGWGLSVIPECALESHREYDKWCLKMAGVDRDGFIQ